MAYKTSDYPKVKVASDAYNVAKAARIKAQQLFDITPTTSKNYAKIKTDLAAAKAKEETTLKAYKSANTAAQADYNKKQTISDSKTTASSSQKAIDILNEKIRKAKDSGMNTKELEAQLKVSQDKLAAALAAKKTATTDNRPTGVPATAKFNSATSQWVDGTNTWDKNGKKVVATKPPVVTKPPTTVTPTKVTGDAGQGSTDILPDAGALGQPITPTPVGETVTSPVVTPTDTTDFQKVYAAAEKQYGGIDAIFKDNEELKTLLIKAIGNVDNPEDDMTADQFTNLLANTNWFKTNAGPIRQRGFYKRQYDSLVTKLKTDDPDYQNKIAELDKTSEYGRGLAKVIQSLQEEATSQGKTLDNTTARALAIDLYDYANETDAVKLRKAVTNAGKFGTAVVGGAAGGALETLRRVAKNNGYDFDTEFADQKDTWLNAVLNGESVDKFSSLIREKAGQSQNKFVQDLLKNGYDLNGVYGNYINLMSQYFDIDPSTIKPNDPLLAKVFSDTGGMKFADFESLLRTDPRFKGTKQAGQTSDIRQSITDRALALGITLGEGEIDDVVNNALSMGVSASSSLVDGLIRAKFTYAPGKTLGGAAGGALASLKATAAANGLDFDKQFGTQAQTWLAKILQGESPDTFKNIIRQTAKLGLPEKVGSLLDLGVDLETIYSPYKNVMSSVLEVNPQTIGLDDKTLRSAIGPDKEMTLYDWERSLRKDARWQYTNNARQEVSSSALGVLRDLGFQG